MRSKRPEGTIHPITRKRLDRKRKTPVPKDDSAYGRLPIRFQRAVDVLVAGGTQTQAAIAAGSNPSSSVNALQVRGWTIAHKPKVRAAIAEREKAAMEEAGLTLTRSWLETKRIAYFDPLKLFDKHGKLLHPKDLDQDTRAAIADFEVEDKVETVNGKKVKKTITRYRFWNKVQALKMYLHAAGLLDEPTSAVINNYITNNTQLNMEADAEGFVVTDDPVEASIHYQGLMSMTPGLDRLIAHRNAQRSPPDDSPPPVNPPLPTSAPETSSLTCEHQDIAPENVRTRRNRIRRAARESADEAMEIWRKLGEQE